MAKFATIWMHFLSATMAVTLWAVVPVDLYAQDVPQTSIAETVASESIARDALLKKAELLHSDEPVDLDEIDKMRSALSEAVSAIQIEIASVNGNISRLQTQIESLGPTPENIEDEPDDVRARRKRLNSQLGEYQVALLDLEEYQDRLTDAVELADSSARGILAERLVLLNPTPLNPANWRKAADRLIEDSSDHIIAIRSRLASRANQNILSTRMVPGSVSMLIGIGFLLFTSLRFTGIVNFAFRKVGQDRMNVWVWLILNAFWILMVFFGTLLVLLGLRLSGILSGFDGSASDNIGIALVTAILFFWISLNIFFPKVPQFSLLKLNHVDATKGFRYFRLLGIAVALSSFLTTSNQLGSVEPVVHSVLIFIIVLPIALILKRITRLLAPLFSNAETAENREADEDDRISEQMGPVLMRLISRFVNLTAYCVPLLALIGYSNASAYLAEGTSLSLALLGVSYIFFRLILAIFESVGRLGKHHKEESNFENGLVPIGVGAAVTAVAVPLLALIWGAQRSDLQGAWIKLRDGVAFGDTRISLTDIVVFFVVFGVGYLLTRSLQAFVRGTVLPRTALDVGGRNALLAGIGYVGIFLAALMAFGSTGLDLSSLALVAGALSVGIGFGLQTIVSNFVSGIILLIERPIKQGDWIEVAGFSGKVQAINVRSTEIETFDRATVIVPNQELIAGTVLNLTHSSMSGRAIVPVGVAYGTDPRKVEKILLEIAHNHPMVLIRPEPQVIFMSFGDSSLNFEIRCILRDVNFKLSAISDMNFEIARRFEEENIEIPFVQRDVNLKNISEFRDLFRKPEENSS